MVNLRVRVLEPAVGQFVNAKPPTLSGGHKVRPYNFDANPIAGFRLLCMENTPHARFIDALLGKGSE